MKKHLHKIFLALGLLLAVAPASAQHSESGYFLEGNLNRHQMNPAFAGERNYVAMPALGNVNASMVGTLNLDAVVRKLPNGQMTTYLHPDISYGDAMSRFDSKNKMRFDLNEQILGFGFRAFGGYNTVSLSARAEGGLSVPGALFGMTKQLENKNYDLSGVEALGQAWTELGLGHSRQFGDNLRLGAKLKMLFGIARMDAKVDNLSLRLQDPSRWMATANAKIQSSVKGLSYEMGQKDYRDKSKGSYSTLDGIDVDNMGLNGFGLGLDLGAEYDMKDVCPGLKLSAALLDLSYINWNNNLVAENTGEAFYFDGFQDIRMKGEGKKIGQQTDDIMDRLTDLTRMEDKGDQGSRSAGIGATFNLGAQYTLQSYQALSFGFLSTTKIHGAFSWNEERFSANIAPLKWFEASTSLAFGTFGAQFGWMLNFHPRGTNFFIAMDRTMSSLSKQGIPVKSRAEISTGINIAFGSRK